MRHGVPGLLCAILFFAGTCGGLSLEADADGWVDAALLLALACFVMAWLLRGATRCSMGLVLAGVASLGVVSAGARVTGREPCALTGLLDADPTLVRFEARLVERFHAPDVARTDLLDRFQPDSDLPPWSAAAELLALHGQQGRVPVSGRVTVSVPTGPHDLVAGDVIGGVGWISGPAAPMNPGERDVRLHAWRSGWVGRVRMDVVPSRQSSAPWKDHLMGMARDGVDEGLVASLDGWCDQSTVALVVAMTTGRRMPGYAALRQTFASTGLSHFLAISGFNVAVLFVTCGVVMELVRVPGRLRAWTLMALAVLFLCVVDVEVSVLRAGIAGLIAGASVALGRGWNAHGALAVAAVVTLAVEPMAAWNTGFQLSYLAVLALRSGTDPVQAVLARVGSVIPAPAWIRGVGRAISVALAASVAASIASTPVTMAWFGTLNPWCALASTMLGPLAAMLTVVATLACVAGKIPLLGSGIGCALALLARTFQLGVDWVGTWPGCAMRGADLPWWWCILTLIATFGWWLIRPRRIRNVMVMGCCTLWSAGLMAWTHPVTMDDGGSFGGFRWTSIAVGDGSVHLIQCHGSAILFDAGTVSRPGAGSMSIVPALRSIGVGRLDAIIVSHPHLDHFSAIPEVMEAMPVARVLLTEPWFDGRAGAAPSALLGCIREHGITPERIHEGVRIRQGPVTWDCLHPPSGFRATAVNDGSAAFVLHHSDLQERPLALLVGDAQDQSIARLLARRDILRPWVMELPHHGGWRPIAQALCEWVQPSFVIQSTGARRFRRDRFDACLQGVMRGVTCRDGAIRFSVDLSEQGPVLERWSGWGWEPLRPQ